MEAAKLGNVLDLATLVATLLRFRARACVVLACIAAMLCTANIASANSLTQSKTRVWDFELATPLHIRLERSATQRLHRENRSASAEVVSGSLLAAKGGLESAPTLYNLGRQLAHEEAASAFTSTGELSSEAIQGARELPIRLGNPEIPSGFSKFSTETFRSPSGPFQVHFYMNPTSGEIFYGLDYKAVFNNGIVPYTIGGP